MNGTSSGNDFVDLLTFRRMVTPLILQVVFWIGVAGFVLYGGTMLFAGLSGNTQRGRADREVRQAMNYGYGASNGPSAAAGSPDFGEAFTGLLVMALGPVGWRIYCELMIVIFRIHSELVTIGNRSSSVGGPPPPPLPRG